MPRTLGSSTRLGFPLRLLSLAAGIVLWAPPVAAQQCLGFAPTAQVRTAITADAARSNHANQQRTRVMVALSRAMALTGSAVRSAYFDGHGMPWEARGAALQLSVEGPTAETVRYRLCPTVEVGGLRSNVADWGTPQEWKLTRFAPGIAAGWAHAATPDLTVTPFAAGSLVIESFETLQPSTTRDTRTYAVAEVGVGLVLYRVITLRLSVPVPVGRDEGYPGPYTMRTLAASIAWSR
jgi:hypothetical protein